MCGCPEMESYEDFCLRRLAALQEEKMCEPLLEAHSVIHFHGRPALPPLVRNIDNF